MIFVTAPGESASLPPKLGRYELITRIGQGGMAEVQLALQRGPAGFEKLVVVKLVHENLASQKPFVDMLLDEARVAALVKHPNVVDIYDLGEVGGRYFIAMEYLEGEPLLAVLRAGRDGQRLDVLSTARLIADTAEGLDAAHELRSIAGDPIELVHHDISLGNIVVLYNGQVKLVDFGVAKATQSATARTKVQGKFGYMAPEKLRGGPGDRRSDIWSLGCVLWEALTLRRLFKGGNDPDTMQQVLDIPILAPSKVNGDVPPDFDPIAMRSLARDPALRYPTAKAMAAELEEVLRKHGYAAKNDLIAKYMQATFASHIAARKKLLQEVSSKGRPSQDVLEAAFNLGTLATGSPVLPASDSWSRTGAIDSRPPPRLPPPKTPRKRADDAAAEPAARTPERGAPPPSSIGADAGGDGRLDVLEPGPSRSGTPAAGEATQVERPVDTRRRWTVYAAGAAAAVAAVIVAGLLVAGRRGVSVGSPALFEPEAPPAAQRPAAAAQPPAPAAQPPAAAAQPPAPEVQPPAPRDPEPEIEPPRVPAPAATGHAGDARAADPAQPPAAEASTEPTARPARRHAQGSRPAAPGKPASEKAGPDELVKEGLQAWMRGDHRSAVALCKRATQGNPGYGRAWRLMGLAYEQLGEKANARTAFEKYLQFSPGASDAGDIRARLGGL